MLERVNGRDESKVGKRKGLGITQGLDRGIHRNSGFIFHSLMGPRISQLISLCFRSSYEICI